MFNYLCLLFRPGYMFGVLTRWPSVFEVAEHLDQHIFRASKPISDHKILVIGTKMPWIEAILLEKGAKHVTSLVPDWKITKSTHPNITIISPSEMSRMWGEGQDYIYINYLNLL